MNLLILFVVSAVTLGLEILLTRVFSVVLFASHSFIAISLALLGTGSGALLVYFAKPLDKEKLQRRQIMLLAFLSITVIVSLWALLQIEFVPQRIEDPRTQITRDNLSFLERVTVMERNPELFKSWKLYGAIPIAFFPFLLAGYLQALIFRTDPKKFGMMYGIDLIGATFGSISMPLLLYPFGLKGTVFVMAAAAVLPVLYAFATGQRTLRVVAACLAPVLVMGGLWASGSFQVRYAAGFAERELIREHWSPMSRVALMMYRGQQMYVIDNGSRSYYVPKTDDNIRRYMRSLYTIPFQMKQGGDMLVIASGGGQELTMASHFGMNRIDAVEIARPMVTDIVQNQKDGPGNPYLLPNVYSHIADGRSVIMRSKHTYDVIEMMDVNFATVAGQVSSAWSPNFVSTQEAFSEYIEHLKEDGFLCYSLFSYTRSPMAGEKSRRLVSLVAGMKMAGIEQPQDRLAILSRPSGYGFGYQTMYMVKKTPFTRDEWLKIRGIAASRNARIDVLFPDLEKIIGGDQIQLPGGEELQKNRTYLQGVADICRDTKPIHGLMATLGIPNQRGVPLNDDRPYLVGSGLNSNASRYETLIGGLYKPLLVIMGILAFAFLILPFIVRRPGGGEKVKIDPRLVLILVLTGVGFMFIEMAGIYKYQLYLHHPTLAMIVVLSSMILGAGLGSLHSGRISEDRKERRIAPYSGGAVLVCLALFVIVPVWGHRFLLWLPMSALMPLVFVAFTALGYLFGHVVPLSIDTYSRGQSNLLAWCWAITVTGSVFGTVLASILARDYGMSLVAILGILSYLGVIAVNLAGMAIARLISARAAETVQTG
jgi:SAM-dependent methyltransferase